MFCALALTDNLNLPAVYLLSLAFGFVTALDNPTRRTLLVDLVDEPGRFAKRAAVDHDGLGGVGVLWKRIQ